jgi:hypothetical protein
MYKLFLLVCVFVIANSLAATDVAETVNSPILVIGAQLEGRLDDSETAGYSLLINELLPDRDDVNYQSFPLQRAIRTFEMEDRSCLFPTSIFAAALLTAVDPGEMIQSDPIDLVTSHFLTRKGEPTIDSWGQIDQHKVAIQQSVELSAVNRGLSKPQIVRTPNDRVALRMLMAGRVDVFYGWYPDSVIIAEAEGLELPDFNPNFVVFETTTHIVCKKGINAEPVLEYANRKIQALKQSGELRKMLGPHARIAKD